jgi:adenine phosphoribosyltransferase
VVNGDDLRATGGTRSAAVDLVRKAGGAVLKCLVIIELLGLKGAAKVDAPLYSTFKYD